MKYRKLFQLFILVFLITGCNIEKNIEPDLTSSYDQNKNTITEFFNAYPLGTVTPETQTGTPYPFSTVTNEDISNKKLASLKYVALMNDDIPYASDSLFSFFIDPRIIPSDNSKELIDLCTIDCVKKVWADPDKRRAFVIVMYRVSDPDTASKKVEEALAHEIKTFGSRLNLGKIILPELPRQSWITSSERIPNLVGDLITIQTSLDTVVIILSEQGDLKIRETPRGEYYLALQKLAVIQLGKLKQAGYTQ
jgi:hypothetical protein